MYYTSLLPNDYKPFCRVSSMDLQSQYANQEMAYDLRQRYAKIVGDHLDDISYYRKARDYPDYFRALDDLYTIVQHKFKANKKKKEEEKREEELKRKEYGEIKKKVDGKKKKKKKEKEEDTKTYDDLRTELITISNTYTDAWLGKTDTPEEVAKIEEALRDVEKYLLEEMDIANMFGSKREVEALV